jgi:hypothetical protein
LQSQRAQYIIEKNVTQFAPVKRISIIDTRGLIVFDTNRTFLQTLVARAWYEKIAEDGDQLWRTDFQKLRAADAPIRNTAGEVVAYVVLLSVDARTRNTGFNLIMSIEVLSIVFLSLGLALSVLLAMGVGKQIQTITQPSIDDLSRLAYGVHAAPEAYSDISPAEDIAPFSQPLLGALKSIETTQKNIHKMVGP